MPQDIPDSIYYGKDIVIAKAFSFIDGRPNLIRAIVRRLRTPIRGLFYDQTYGLDVRSYLNDGLVEDKISEIQFKIKSQCELDERIKKADVRVEYIPSSFSLKLSIELYPEQDNPFTLILSVDKLTVEILNNNEEIP